MTVRLMLVQIALGVLSAVAFAFALASSIRTESAVTKIALLIGMICTVVFVVVSVITLRRVQRFAENDKSTEHPLN